MQVYCFFSEKLQRLIMFSKIKAIITLRKHNLFMTLSDNFCSQTSFVLSTGRLKRQIAPKPEKKKYIFAFTKAERKTYVAFYTVLRSMIFLKRFRLKTYPANIFQINLNGFLRHRFFSTLLRQLRVFLKKSRFFLPYWMAYGWRVRTWA